MSIVNNTIVQQVKSIVSRYDAAASIVLFGSRARGDWEQDSDWDFLILTNMDAALLHRQVRNDILEEIEFITFESVQTIVRSTTDWHHKLHVTEFFKSIEHEGIAI